MFSINHDVWKMQAPSIEIVADTTVSCMRHAVDPYGDGIRLMKGL